MGLELLVSGGTSLSVPVNALMAAVDEGIGERARDFREEVVVKGIELATAAGLNLPVNVTAGGALVWHKGKLHAVSAGTTVAGLPDDSTLYVYYDADRSGNKFYASAVAMPAGTADVRVGIAVTAGSTITSVQTLLHGARNWRRCYNASGGQLAIGDAVVLSGAGDWQVTTTASAGDQDAIGVVAETIAAGAWGVVDFSGPVLVRCTGTVARGDLLETSATAGAAQVNNAPETPGATLGKAAGARSGAGTSLVPAILTGAGGGGGAHDLLGADHTLAGATPREIFTALTATTFGFKPPHAASGTLGERPGSPDATGDLYFATDTDALYVGSGGSWVQIAARTWRRIHFLHYHQGDAVVGVKLDNLSFRVTDNCTLEHVHIYADTAPAGTSFVLDVNLNGATVFTTQGNRPAVAAGAHVGTSGTPDVTAAAEGDLITFDPDMVGNGPPGADYMIDVTAKLQITTS
jgi:hypothetical protein